MRNELPKRFAGLVRVSTEGQKKGASLDTQKDCIKGSVEQLGGNPLSINWYDGEEHGTEGFERKICDKLLADAKKQLFDAVIVFDLSRWSRHNLRSKTNLEILRRNGVRFFEGTKEYNLSDYDDIFYIGIMTEINERAAKEIKAKMSEGKITRAQQGWAVSSPKKLPWGRTFDNDKKKHYASVYDRWGLIDGAKEKMNEIVNRYIKKEKTDVLAKELGTDTTNLLKIFWGCLGNEWQRKFFSPRKNEKVPVDIPIPALIENEEKIREVHKRIDSNKTWTHGSYKEDYIFSSMIYCNDCKHALTGITKKGIHYYYHFTKYKKNCSFKRYVLEKDLEEAVLSHIFHMYKDKKKIAEAVIRAYPNQEEYKKHIAEDSSDKKELMKLQKEKDKIVEGYGKELFSDEEVEITLNKYRERIKLFENKIEKRKPLLGNVPPTSEEIEEESNFYARMVQDALSSPSRLSRMSFEDKRRLVKMAFGGKDDRGNRLGIYVEQGSSKQSIKYTLKGMFSNHIDYKEQISGQLPMSLDEIQRHLRIDPDYEGDYNPFDETEIKKAQIKKKKRQKKEKSHSKRGKVESSCRSKYRTPGIVHT
jgi:DNA invertase Pin-like site-specific DNA recombinase